MRAILIVLAVVFGLGVSFGSVGLSNALAEEIPPQRAG